jgi:hypothetical protein
MIRFFRRIRQKLVSENVSAMTAGRFGKYMIYAIGEIILVVIGILIALQINNWNEERKAADYTKLLFKKTFQELQFNIEKANDVVDMYRGKDSILYNVVNKKVSRDDYLSSNEYVYLLMSGEFVLLTDEAFQKLINSEANMTEEQDSLLSNLKLLYSTSLAEVGIGDDNLPNFLFGMHTKYKNEQPWFFDYHNFGVKSDAMIDYLLNDPRYLNDVTYYGIEFLGQHLKSTMDFRVIALERYKELADYLEIARDTSIIKDLKHYQHYLGTYETDIRPQWTYEIKEEDDQLMVAWRHKTDKTRFGERIFHPDSKTYFTNGARRLAKLLYDDNNEVTGFYTSDGARRTEYKKIN